MFTALRGSLRIANDLCSSISQSFNGACSNAEGALINKFIYLVFFRFFCCFSFFFKSVSVDKGKSLSHIPVPKEKCKLLKKKTPTYSAYNWLNFDYFIYFFFMKNPIAGRDDINHVILKLIRKHFEKLKCRQSKLLWPTKRNQTKLRLLMVPKLCLGQAENR